MNQKTEMVLKLYASNSIFAMENGLFLRHTSPAFSKQQIIPQLVKAGNDKV